MNLQQVTTTFLALVAIYAPSPAQAQQQGDVTVNDHHYQVTPFMNGRMLRITDSANPQRTAMVQVSGDNIKLLSPAGVDDATMTEIKAVVSAYQHPNGGAAPQPTLPPANDQAAALRQQALELQQQTLQRAAQQTGNGPAGKITPEFPASGGAIVHGTPFGDIVFNEDATVGHFTRKSSNGLTGNTTQTWEYDYVGDKNKAGAVAKGVGGALAGAFNVRHAGRVDEGGIEVYLQTNNNKPEHEYGTRQKTFAVNPYVRNPLDNGIRQQAVGFLQAAKEALQAAKQAAEDQKVQSFRPDADVIAELNNWEGKL